MLRALFPWPHSVAVKAEAFGFYGNSLGDSQLAHFFLVGGQYGRHFGKESASFTEWSVLGISTTRLSPWEARAHRRTFRLPRTPVRVWTLPSRGVSHGASRAACFIQTSPLPVTRFTGCRHTLRDSQPASSGAFDEVRICLSESC